MRIEDVPPRYRGLYRKARGGRGSRQGRDTVIMGASQEPHGHRCQCHHSRQSGT